jgi:outer membrane assembly lipoprotein YfiO
MRRILGSFFFCALLVFSLGCPQKSARLQKSVVPPDKTLFETGSDFLKKSQYIKARLAFQNLIMTYPDSDMAAESYFAVGDSFYEEGGTENYLQAENQFKDFIVFFPAHPKAPDAQMKIISINMRMMGSPDRDQRYAYKALPEIKKFLQQYPDSDFVPIVKQWQADVEEKIAKGEFGIGRFYEERNNFAGAMGRYKEIMTKYPDFSTIDEVYHRIGSDLEKVNNPDEAAIYYGKIISEYPFSKNVDAAKARMNALGKALPPVNPKLAALNQAKVKAPEGFSPLRPLIDFTKALGIIGVPDKYEEAKKIVEAEKAKEAEAAEKQTEVEQASGDIQIETIIKKSASGETRDTTILGGSPKATSQNVTDKKKEAQKTKKKYARKPS